MKILFVVVEVAPWAQTGGLGDVAGSLPQALLALGHDIRLAVPRYRQMPNGTFLAELKVEPGSETARIYQENLPGTSGHPGPLTYLISNPGFFDRNTLYGYADDARRFIFFCLTVLEMLPHLMFKPDIIHCNDWQTALLPLYLKKAAKNSPFYQGVGSLFTIHNLRYQGLLPREILATAGLEDYYFSWDKLEFHNKVNLMKAGLVYADLINTVSEGYAREITTPEYGEGLEGLLAYRFHDLHGIINGIDDSFNPANDPALYHQYSCEDLSGKAENKNFLQRDLGLAEGDYPLLGLVARLTEQKGIDLVAALVERMAANQIQLVVLGSGDEYWEKNLDQLSQRFPKWVAYRKGFLPTLAHKIYAAADAFLMPSQFEPCGLGQLIALRYGTVPIVRATGGLKDTVFEYNPEDCSGNGFLFEDYTPESLWQAINKALALRRDYPRSWQKLQLNGIRGDYSWHVPATSYTRLYNLIIEKAR